MTRSGAATLARLGLAMSAATGRIAVGNRYPMRLVGNTRNGTVGVVISETEYVMTGVEMRALRDLLDVGIERVGT